MPDSLSLKSFLKPTSLIAIASSIFQLYAVVIGFLHPLILYPIHVTFAVVLVFLSYPTRRESKGSKFLDGLLVLFTFALGLYLFLNFERYSTRIPFVHS